MILNEFDYLNEHLVKLCDMYYGDDESNFNRQFYDDIEWYEMVSRKFLRFIPERIGTQLPDYDWLDADNHISSCCFNFADLSSYFDESDFPF